MVRAMSSRHQRVADEPWSAGSLVAMEMTWSCPSGGKDRRSAGSRGVLEAGEAVLGVATPPQRDGVPRGAQLAGDPDVGGVIRPGGAEDDADPSGQGLGRRAGAREGLELPPLLGVQVDLRGERGWHGRRPCHKKEVDPDARIFLDAIISAVCLPGLILTKDLRNADLVRRLPP
jgi:hypothetical protein